MIGLQSLRLLLEHEIEPIAILVPDGKHVDGDVVEAFRCELPHAAWFRGKAFRSEAGLAELESLNLDYLLSVHFPYLIPKSVLRLPRVGALNLHPAYLPYNRGWHTPSWAILEKTPYGATLHWMDEGMDTGDLALQCPVAVQPDDTADSLYARVLLAELEMLREAIPMMITDSLPRNPQRGVGSAHRKADLDNVRRLHLHERMTVGEVLQRLRGLTTNRQDEAAWFEADGRRYLVQLTIRQDESYERPSLEVRRAA